MLTLAIIADVQCMPSCSCCNVWRWTCVAWGSPAEGGDSNAILHGVTLPSILQSLTFGFTFEFNQSLLSVTLPHSPKTLTFLRLLQPELGSVALRSSLQKSIALPSRCYYLRFLLNVTLPTVGYHSGRGLCFDLGRC